MITTDEFIQNFESKTQTDVVVLDFSKAFDVVPHQRLLHKLDHYGIRGTTLNWIQNFLTTRAQKVVVDGSSSESARVRSGVPQGTVLGPLLFLTYINDLPSTVSSAVHLFADDCLLYRPIKCRADQEQLQRDLSALQDWADRWGMCFNPSKCSVLRVSRPKFKKLELEYTLNPFHAYPGPCPGILILITMPIPDRVRASLQLIHCMLNSRQVWPDASSVLQNNIGVYYSAIW